MSSNDIAILVTNLSKCYEIYDSPRDRLKQFFMSRVRRMTGKANKQYFHEFWALKDLSFEIKKGETIGIVGRNGSGKSTLLEMICGTLTPTSGSVETRGRVAALLELGSGFNPEFTGRENVYMNAAVLGLSNQEIDERFEDISAFADIGDFIEQPVKTYSSGMLLRLAFAVQAMVDPDILIVDEALAVGDERFQRKCFARLKDLKNNGTSIIFVSHLVSQVIELCDRAILLDHGVGLMFANPMQVVRAYQKLIYAPQDEQNRLVLEYQTSNSTEDFDDHPGKDDFFEFTEAIDEDLFDPNMLPESTTIYTMSGAEIQSIQIMDVEGRKVNLLHTGRNYKFVVAGQFTDCVNDVYFGIHLRTTSGMVITGQRYPEEGRHLDLVQGKTKFQITFELKMILVPGVYFVGAGIWSLHEPICRHRVVDAIMFRLNPDSKCDYFGYVVATEKEPDVEFY